VSVDPEDVALVGSLRRLAKALAISIIVSGAVQGTLGASAICVYSTERRNDSWATWFSSGMPLALMLSSVSIFYVLQGIGILRFSGTLTGNGISKARWGWRFTTAGGHAFGSVAWALDWLMPALFVSLGREPSYGGASIFLCASATSSLAAVVAFILMLRTRRVMGNLLQRGLPLESMADEENRVVVRLSPSESPRAETTE
jgi:hypothetical protein